MYVKFDNTLHHDPYTSEGMDDADAETGFIEITSRLHQQ